MLIVDSQIHIWGADTPERPWPKDRTLTTHREIPFTQADLVREMNAGGIDRAIIVPPSWEGDRNDLAMAAAQAHPNRLAVMGRLDPDAPESRSLVASWKQQPGMLGLRFVLRTPPLSLSLTEGRMEWLWPEAEKHGIPICVFVSHEMVPLIDKIAERYPGLKLVMDHSAVTAGKDEVAFKDFDKLLPIAKRPNVATKASCFPYFTNDVYPYKKVHPYLRQLYDAFGPKRMFWGTDLTRLPCTYRQAVTMFTEELPWLKGQDLEWVMGRAACEWFDWKI